MAEQAVSRWRSFSRLEGGEPSDQLTVLIWNAGNTDGHGVGALQVRLVAADTHFAMVAKFAAATVSPSAQNELSFADGNRKPAIGAGHPRGRRRPVAAARGAVAFLATSSFDCYSFR